MAHLGLPRCIIVAVYRMQELLRYTVAYAQGWDSGWTKAGLPEVHWLCQSVLAA